MSTLIFTTPSQSRKVYKSLRRNTLSKPVPNTPAADEISNVSHRWIVLFIICFSMFAYSYCYDNPVALQNQLQSTYNLTDIQYNLLYSAYTFPNMILPFFSGVLADILSADLMTIIFFTFIMLGHGLFIFGCVISYYPLMFIGRFVFGIGAESFSLVITPLIYEYFKNKELSFALGALLSLSRMGSSTNDYATLRIFQHTKSVIIALSAGFILLIIAFIALSALIIQRYSKRIAIKSKKSSNLPHIEASSNGNGNGTKNDSLLLQKKTTMDDTLQNKMIANYRNNKAVSYDERIRFHHSVSINSVNNVNNSVRRPSYSLSEKPIFEEKSDENVADKFRWKDILEFDSVFWLLVVNCGLIYGVVLSFMNIGSDYLQTHYAYSHQIGNTLLMIVYIVAAVLTPFLGYLSDKVGKRPYLLLISTVMLIGTNYVLTWMETEFYLAVAAMSGLGISYSVFCAVIWPSFAIIVPDKLIGTGYGIPCVFYNGVLSIFYLLVGVLTSTGDSSPSDEDYYQNVQIFLFSLAIFSTFTVLCLVIADMRTGSRLNAPTIK